MQPDYLVKTCETAEGRSKIQQQKRNPENEAGFVTARSSLVLNDTSFAATTEDFATNSVSSHNLSDQQVPAGKRARKNRRVIDAADLNDVKSGQEVPKVESFASESVQKATTAEERIGRQLKSNSDKTADNKSNSETAFYNERQKDSTKDGNLTAKTSKLKTEKGLTPVLPEKSSQKVPNTAEKGQKPPLEVKRVDHKVTSNECENFKGQGLKQVNVPQQKSLSNEGQSIEFDSAQKCSTVTKNAPNISTKDSTAKSFKREVSKEIAEEQKQDFEEIWTKIEAKLGLLSLNLDEIFETQEDLKSTEENLGHNNNENGNDDYFEKFSESNEALNCQNTESSLYFMDPRVENLEKKSERGTSIDKSEQMSENLRQEESDSNFSESLDLSETKISHDSIHKEQETKNTFDSSLDLNLKHSTEENNHSNDVSGDLTDESDSSEDVTQSSRLELLEKKTHSKEAIQASTLPNYTPSDAFEGTNETKTLDYVTKEFDKTQNSQHSEIKGKQEQCLTQDINTIIHNKESVDRVECKIIENSELCHPTSFDEKTEGEKENMSETISNNANISESSTTIPQAPPPPPPGFLVPLEKPKTANNCQEKPKLSGPEKALIKQLESIHDPTFVGFLKSQKMVKSHSRDRSEVESEM